MKSWPAVFLLLAALRGAFPCRLAAEQPALVWVNRFRAAQGAAPLGTELALDRAAAAYARALAASGRLSHRDASGRNCLARYRAAGGSAARAGEILGAGPALAAVTAAWEASPAHAAAARDPRWTRAGAGNAAAADGSEVWVVLFAEQRVEDFAVTREPGGGYLVSGSFRDAEAEQPVLLSGLEDIEPAGWDPDRRRFQFRLPASAGPRYHRLGFRAREFTLTSAFYPELAAER